MNETEQLAQRRGHNKRWGVSSDQLRCSARELFGKLPVREPVSIAPRQRQPRVELKELTQGSSVVS